MYVEHRYMLDSWYNLELYKPEVHAPTKLREILRHWRIGLEEVAHKISTGTYTTLYCLHIIWDSCRRSSFHSRRHTG